jgi:hypothetical protein
MYLLPINFPVDLIGFDKIKPLFHDGSSKRVVTSFVKLYVVSPLTLWHASHDLQYSMASMNIVGH